MAVRAQAIIPALADRLGLRGLAGEADRHAHARGQGASSASNSGAMPAATRLSQLSRLSCVMPSTPSNRLSGDGHAIGRNTRQERRPERGQRDRWGGAAQAASDEHGPSIPVAGRGGRDRLSPQRRSTPAPPAPQGRGLARPRARIVTLCAKTACGLGRSQAEIEPCPQGRAHNHFLMSD
jgi:hypothetical protein